MLSLHHKKKVSYLKGSKKQQCMNEELKKKRDEVLRRFLAARDRKKEYLVEMEERMRRNYKLRTGMDATNFSAL